MGANQQKIKVDFPRATPKTLSSSKNLRGTRFSTEVKNVFFDWQIRFLKEIVEEIPYPIIILDKFLQAIAANKKASQVAAQASRKIVGRSIKVLAQEWLMSKDIPKFLNCLNKGKDAAGQCRLLFGNLTPVLINIKRVRDNRNQNTLCFLISIKEKKDQRQNLKTRHNLLGTISHELKTPLTAIKAFGQLANLSMGKKDKKTIHYLQKIDEEINRAISLINDVFDVSKIHLNKFKINKSENSLDKLLQETVEEIELTNHTHKINLSGRIGRRIRIDRDRIKQVLLNILNNAFKYSPETKDIDVNLTKNNLAAQITIRDYGQGIERSHLESIFGRFYQDGEKRDDGLGLGLYLSKKIVKEHGGHILVSSQKNKGSIFTIILPFK